MIHLKYEKLGFSNCEQIYSSWGDVVQPPSNLNSENQKLRDDILKIHDQTMKNEKVGVSLGKFDKYTYDLLFGLGLYELLNEKRGFTLRHASDPDIWRYITMNIVPDIVFMRWKKDSTDRYYRRPTRIYLSSLWWYIHLSWCGNSSSTYEILKENSTDEIMNLVERSGSLGYRIDFTRELMKQYSKTINDDRLIFRKVLKLNTARSIVLEPALHHSGVEGYVRDLFEDVMRGVLHEEASGSY